MGGTIRALREGGVPVAHRFVGVARQRGSSRGTLHSDHRNYMLSTLTPLVVPGPCGVLGRSRASGGLGYHQEERRLQPGETVILDNSFPHQVYNDAEADRFVLMCEVWHPALTPAEREALVTLFALKDRFTLLELKQRPWGALGVLGVLSTPPVSKPESSPEALPTVLSLRRRRYYDGGAAHGHGDRRRLRPRLLEGLLPRGRRAAQAGPQHDPSSSSAHRTKGSGQGQGQGQG